MASPDVRWQYILNICQMANVLTFTKIPLFKVSLFLIRPLGCRSPLHETGIFGDRRSAVVSPDGDCLNLDKMRGPVAYGESLSQQFASLKRSPDIPT